MKDGVIEGGRELLHPLVHSSNDHNGQDWARLKPRASLRSSAGLQVPKHLDHPSLLSQPISRELGQKQSNRVSNRPPVQDAGITTSGTTVLAPGFCFWFKIIFL